MPTVPKRVTLTNASEDVLNAIRNHASVNYQDYVPIATPNAESIREIGAIIMDYPEIQNEFLNALVNRIAKVVINSMAFSNPWAIFKRGFIEFGETVEEIFVDIATPHEYDPEVAERELFKREFPNVKSAFHPLNYQKFYKVTIQQDDLKHAFLSYDGLGTLIDKITQSLYKGMEYDEFLTMRYLLVRNLLDNHMFYIPSMGALNENNAKATLTALRSINNLMTFPSRDYNVAHVLNKSDISDQQIIIDSVFEANIDVNALASAFNLNYADFMAKRILTPHFFFSPFELERLDEIFRENRGEYRGISPEENEALKGVHAIVCDKNYFMIFDNLQSMRDVPNGQGLYWNYFLHTWKTFSVSPFANCVALVDNVKLNMRFNPDIILTNENGEPVRELVEGVKYYLKAEVSEDELPTTQTIETVRFIKGAGTIGQNNSYIIVTSQEENEITLEATYTNGEKTTNSFNVT